MKRLCFSSPHTGLFSSTLSLWYVLYDQTRALFSPRSQFDDVASLYSLSLFSSPSQKRTSTRVFLLTCVAKEGLASSLFAGKKRREIFRFEFIIDRVLPIFTRVKTTTQLNSPLSSATILIPQNFFFLYEQKHPHPKNKTKRTTFMSTSDMETATKKQSSTSSSDTTTAATETEPKTSSSFSLEPIAKPKIKWSGNLPEISPVPPFLISEENSSSAEKDSEVTAGAEAGAAGAAAKK